MLPSSSAPANFSAFCWTISSLRTAIKSPNGKSKPVRPWAPTPAPCSLAFLPWFIALEPLPLPLLVGPAFWQRRPWITEFYRENLKTMTFRAFTYSCTWTSRWNYNSRISLHIVNPLWSSNCTSGICHSIWCAKPLYPFLLQPPKIFEKSKPEKFSLT